MDYFSILNLNREPFSNSPDPDYFYHSRQHLDCLQKLELSLHLRRGLNVIIGEVGTGKTTLCRQLIRRFAQRKEVETHLILDPLFEDSGDFLSTVVKLLSGKKMPEGTTDWQAKEFIKHSLFRKGVDQKKITVLIIDEGQKIPAFCLELLREFLNYETNEYKLLQIVIFAQKEFEAVIRQYPNFGDRINLFHHLKPLSFQDTRMMIMYRLERSSTTPRKLNFFTLPALLAIYLTTGGYPRKIINLCHQCILAMIIQNKSKVEYPLARRCATRVFTADRRGRGLLSPPVITVGALAALLLLLWAGVTDRWPMFSWQRIQYNQTPLVEIAKLPPQSSAAAVRSSPAASSASGEPSTVVAAAPSSPSAGISAGTASRKSLALSALPTSSAIISGSELETAKAPTPMEPQTMPEVLGAIKLKRYETISGLIQKVYGTYSNKHFRSILFANPGINDPNVVEVGRSIQLPALPVSVNPLNKDVWWVRIGEWSLLQEAFELLRTYPDSAPPVRLIPCWQPTTGLRFVVIHKQFFSSFNDAELHLKNFPPKFASSAQVTKLWNEQTVFFADPY